MDICITDSLCCTLETNTILYINYTPVKILKKYYICIEKIKRYRRPWYKKLKSFFLQPPVLITDRHCKAFLCIFPGSYLYINMCALIIQIAPYSIQRFYIQKLKVITYMCRLFIHQCIFLCHYVSSFFMIVWSNGLF